jgi:hypothetical protein
MKYTTLLIVALLATSVISTDGCESKKCANCENMADANSCVSCVGSKPKLIDSGKYWDCSAVQTTGCWWEGKTSCMICNAATHYNKAGTCIAYSVTIVKPDTTKCLEVTGSVVGTATTDSGVCTACAGAFAPAATATTPVCGTTALVVGEAVIDCAAHTATKKCWYCSAGTKTDGGSGVLDTCTAWTKDNMGCLASDCKGCNAWAGYWNTSFKAPFCSKFAKILSAAGMIVALFLANF